MTPADNGLVSDRCPSCAALVAADASWCGQCYARLVTEPVPPPRPPVTAGAAVALLPAEIPPPPAPPATSPDGLRLARQPWPCPSCETVNSFELDTCRACGTSLRSAIPADELRLPLVGRLDGLDKSDVMKLALLVGGGLCLLLLVVATVGGLLLG